MKLTDAEVRKTTKVGYHADHSAGLYAVVRPSKGGGVTKSWAVRYNAPNGKRRESGLGRYPEISLSVARELARAARIKARGGVDPIEARKEARRQAERADVQAITFEQCCEAFLVVHGPAWNNEKHRKQWATTLRRYAYPKIGDKQVNEIDRAMIMQVLEPIWNEKRETARRLRGRLEEVLKWAADPKQHFRDGDHNPAARSNLALKRRRTKPVQHHPALPYTEMAAFMSKLRAMDGTAARALEFAILTAARTGEVLGAPWHEIDTEKARCWIVPAARMKADREHSVPLSEQATQLLRDVRATQPSDAVYVFANPNGGALSNMSLLMTLRRMGRVDITAHGMRSTFRDWVGDCTEFHREVAEAALAHIVGDQSEAAYRRGTALEKRRKLMQSWADFCEGPTRKVIAAQRRKASTP